MDILEDLYNKHIPLKIYKTLKHYTDFDLLYDFEQEMMLAIALHGPEKLKQLYEANELDNYFARICINQIVHPIWHPGMLYFIIVLNTLTEKHIVCTQF